VAVIAWNDMWAVGSQDGSAVALHRDGVRWSSVPTPPPPAGGYQDLRSVSAASSSNVWAVGASTGGALMEHWDGTSWSVVPSPAGIHGALVDVAMRKSGWGWAIGKTVDGTTRGVILRHCQA
jgi:hypothetical protein